MDPEEEAQIQQMLMSLLTNRAPEPVHEQTELDAARGKKAAEMMSSEYWAGEPMYYNPASSFNFTDENVHRSLLERLAHDAQHRPRPEDLFYRDAWQEGKEEGLGHPDWAYPPGTPPWWNEPDPSLGRGRLRER